jgi:hypothetical protein
MNDTRFTILRGRIGQLLGSARPNLYPEDDLFETLKAVVLPKPLRGELDYVTGEMEKAGQLLRHRCDRGVVKCKLTESGEAELLS